MTAIFIIKWWSVSLLLGTAFLPVTARLFRIFDDRGWLFSKVLGMMLGGYAVWALSVCFHMPFTRMTAILVTVFLAVLFWGVKWLTSARLTGQPRADGGVRSRFSGRSFGISSSGSAKTPDPDFRLIIAEEILFLAVLIIWVYFIGFYPEATGTEKPMDYGFMAAFDRSTVMPAKDIWYGTDGINYYYGGQYFAVYFAKLAFTEVTYAYNMMRALIAAFVFVMPFSMVRQLLMTAGNAFETRLPVAVEISLSASRQKTADKKNPISRKIRIIAALGGILASGAVSCAGNLHYVLYGLFGKLFRLSGWEDYWFPESTRFIGHNPPTDDACIHEFPSYSFVLGDMHAHMINLIFVLLFLGILTAWLLEAADSRLCKASKSRKNILQPHLLLLAAMTGMFKWTNYWDFIIYLTVLIFGMGLLLIWNVRHDASLKQQAGFFVVRLITVWLIGKAAAYPFTSRFDMMVSSVALAKNHTAFYQYAILWGLPVVTLIIYALWLIRCRKKAAGTSVFMRSQAKSQATISVSYYIAVLLGICALGLILIPEIVYVKDIYEEGYSRSNTMFKLTYQAFVMFGLFFGFALPELLVNRLPESLRGQTSSGNTATEQHGDVITAPAAEPRDDSDNSGTEESAEASASAGTSASEGASASAEATASTGASAEIHPVQLIAGVLTAALLLTFGYLPYSVKSWFGNVLSPDGFIGVSATDFLEEKYPEDAEAIHWLDENVEGQPIVLETWGDSYSDDCRVSAYTGIPTVMGWYVHEWLWRENVDELNKRVEDVNVIYTTTGEAADLDAAKEILRKYDVQYIFVGSCERKKYTDLDEDALKKLGTVVFETDSDLQDEAAKTGNTFIVKID